MTLHSFIVSLESTCDRAHPCPDFNPFTSGHRRCCTVFKPHQICFFLNSVWFIAVGTQPQCLTWVVHFLTHFHFFFIFFFFIVSLLQMHWAGINAIKNWKDLHYLASVTSLVDLTHTHALGSSKAPKSMQWHNRLSPPRIGFMNVQGIQVPHSLLSVL